ncbi:unnamed protein product [Mycena citricolor]|uniref:Uncharacterized protein n=1 Tax=Mycena citricolor TaxID=2018698 RepID=A0AAD2Q573_9AGAR|nr:unnamed protein product [Mycena citricolor]CAK5277035.1 unnamed protein product [Mycena citricolor]CAK5277045.1 unnamed protein product [Mycena citricolor]CAK5282178.1 unnamed protein product [Mycena citricolor]
MAVTSGAGRPRRDIRKTSAGPLLGLRTPPPDHRTPPLGHRQISARHPLGLRRPPPDLRWVRRRFKWASAGFEPDTSLMSGTTTSATCPLRRTGTTYM